jgi:hypothetical protein
MWHVWDLVADHSLSQLNAMIEDSSYEYQNSTFFAEQLTAFEVWLEFGGETKKPPEQLPIVLQVTSLLYKRAAVDTDGLPEEVNFKGYEIERWRKKG